MKTFLTALALLVLLLPAASHAEKPNLLLILADDMGYGDLQFTGSTHLKTPHLDALAESGAFCEQAYVASPVCSPSRAGLITGRDPRRFGYEGNLNKSDASYATRPELLGLPPASTPSGTTSRRRATEPPWSGNGTSESVRDFIRTSAASTTSAAC